jgi:TolB-like protein/tetratricopeptide (TPR) repeat protein
MMDDDAPRGADVSELAETIGGVHAASIPARRRWGPLELRATLGCGAFGIVYRAWDERLRREVALKLIDEAAGLGLGAAVVEEARLLARVRHPNVVVVHGADQFDGAIGIWMELIEGRTLTKVLRQHGPFGADEATLVGIDVCRALAAVHKAGLLHRDIKADNIMREQGGRVVLMDFGAGTFALDQSTIAGTPVYWAPEILARQPATPASDVYAVGVLLYHLVSGKYPVVGENVDELRCAHEEGRRIRLQDERPDLPSAFVRAVEGALDPDEARRFKTPGELQAALGEKEVGKTARTRRSRVLATVLVAGSLSAAAIVWIGRPFLDRASASPNMAALTSINSIAVLPFQETTGDANEKYLANAVPVELTADLAEIGDFKTIPWTFTKEIAGKAKTLTEVAAKSGADGIVEGSVQTLPAPAGGGERRVRISVRLYQGRTGSLLWSQSFEDDLGKFVDINTRIADQIAQRIRVKLQTRREVKLGTFRPVSPEAMELFLRGRDLRLENASSTNLRQAVDLLSLAVSKDQFFAHAYGELAECYALLAAYWHAMPQQEAYPKIMDASARAMALDDTLASVWAARAYARFILGWDWVGAEEDFKRALNSRVDSNQIHTWHAEYLTAMGRHDEAIAATEALVAEIPQSTHAHRQAGWSHFQARRYDQAIQHLVEAVRLDPDYVPARTLLGRAYVQKGLYAQGIAELESVAGRANGGPFKHMLAAAYAISGDKATARRVFDEYLSRPKPADYDVALVYAVLGEPARALDQLEHAYTQHDTALVNLSNDPRLDPLRSEPRFQALVRKMKFPQ